MAEESVHTFATAHGISWAESLALVEQVNAAATSRDFCALAAAAVTDASYRFAGRVGGPLVIALMLRKVHIHHTDLQKESVKVSVNVAYELACEEVASILHCA